MGEVWSIRKGEGQTCPSKDNSPAAAGFSGSVVKRCLPELHQARARRAA